jgi:hypothetical protein
MKNLPLLKSMIRKGERGIFKKISAFKKLELAWELEMVWFTTPQLGPWGFTLQGPKLYRFNILIFFYNSKTKPLGIVWYSVEFGPWAKCEPALNIGCT